MKFKDYLTYVILCYIIIYMENILKDLKEYRLENKLSQKKLAEKLGVTFATVNRWFNGRNYPNEIQVYHIKKLLGIPKLKDTHYEIT